MKRIALLHRYPEDQIKQTNAAFPYLKSKGMDVLTFKRFDRLNDKLRLLKSIAWIFYAGFLVLGKRYDVIYCDDSFPFYPIFVKLCSPRSKVILRMGDFHLMYYTSGSVYWLLHEIEKIGWRMADKIIAISDVMVDRIDSEIYNHPTSLRGTYVVYDPIDPADFPYLNGTNNKRVMFHGLLTKNKNVDVLLKAARLLPNVIFWIIGDGPDRKRLEKKAPNNVIFKGWIPFRLMYYYISRCRIGVALRSNNPGNDYVVTSPFLQYGIMGRSCLVTRRKVFADMGYAWQFSDAIGLAALINILLKKPEEGVKLRHYILENHDAKRIAESIYSHLLA